MRVPASIIRCSTSPITTGLLVHLLFHEMPEIALADGRAGQVGEFVLARRRAARRGRRTARRSRVTTTQSPSSR